MVTNSRSSSRTRRKTTDTTTSTEWWNQRGMKLSPTIPLTLILAGCIRITLSLFLTSTMVPIIQPTLLNKMFFVVLDILFLLFVVHVDGWVYDTRIFALDNLLCLLVHTQLSTFPWNDWLINEKPTAPRMQNQLATFRSRSNMISNMSFAVVTHEDTGWLTLKTINVGNCNIFVLRPKDVDKKTVLPCLLYMHGGGHVIGTAKSVVDRFSKYQLNCPWWVSRDRDFVIISVEYRLAPEHPFPAAADDCTDAFDYVYNNAKRLSIDQNKIILMGISAGGNLAAVVAHHAESRCKATVLLIPEVKRNTTLDMSFMLNGRVPSLPFEMILWFRKLYCEDAEEAKDPKCSPISYSNDHFKRLSPMIVATCSADILRDAGIEYADKAAKNLVSVDRLMFRGSHSFGLWCDTDSQRELWAKVETLIFED